MTTLTRYSLLILGVLALVEPASAGWQSPYELTCFRRRQPQTVYYVAPPMVQAGCCNSTPVVSAYVPPAPVVAQYANPCPPPPQQVCTQYVPKTYYQQVTNYQPHTVMEPRTELRTSYYYEPVTSYRYSYAYDPCNCSYQTVATPQTCYQLRSQSTPITTYVQKTQMVPVTQYRQMTYYEAQTTVTPAPAPVVGPWTTTPPAGAITPVQNVLPGAGVQESRQPNAGVQEMRTPAGSNDSPLNRQYNNPPANVSGRAPANYSQPAVTPRPDRITSNQGWKPLSATLAKHPLPE